MTFSSSSVSKPASPGATTEGLKHTLMVTWVNGSIFTWNNRHLSPEHRVSDGEALQPPREGEGGGGGVVVGGGHRLPPQQVHKAFDPRLDQTNISFAKWMKILIKIGTTYLSWSLNAFEGLWLACKAPLILHRLLDYILFYKCFHFMKRDKLRWRMDVTWYFSGFSWCILSRVSQTPPITLIIFFISIFAVKYCSIHTNRRRRPAMLLWQTECATLAIPRIDQTQTRKREKW